MSLAVAIVVLIGYLTVLVVGSASSYGALYDHLFGA